MQLNLFLAGASAVAAILLLQSTSAQIPTVCSDADSLENTICCPTTTDGVCGENANRGQCVSLATSPRNDTADVRANWPHYFTQICQCTGNYGGYDCSRCKFGYYGENCSQFQVLPRRPLRNYTDEEWSELNRILRLTKTYESDYVIILEEQVAGTSNQTMVNVSLYNLYVWIHHYGAKDSRSTPNDNRIDYGHFGPGFITWHRYLNIWLEHETQWMLRKLGWRNYYDFRIPYWDWRRESQLLDSGMSAEELFSENRFGNTVITNGLPIVNGAYSNWDTICWGVLGEVCNPRESTGQLQRCPVPDRCTSSNPDWSGNEDINAALNFDDFDLPPWRQDAASDALRNFLDVKFGSDFDACREDRLCVCMPSGDPSCEAEDIRSTVTLQLHLSVHVIAGIGDFTMRLPRNETGVIDDVASSANDPLFIPHHAMVDCIFEEWLRRHPNAEYPDAMDVPQGHLRNGYIVPLFPLYTHNDMFRGAKSFGYSCSLPDLEDAAGITTTEDSHATATFKVIILWPTIFMAFVLINNLVM